MPLLTAEEFGALWDDFRHSAFKFEVRDRYSVSSEQESLSRFLADEPDPDRARRPWLARMKTATQQGKRIERVRVVSEPHSDYVRWLLAGGPLNAEAGEDIRYLPRPKTEGSGLPGYDFALFDSRQLVRLHFDENDRPLRHELVTDPAVVVRHCYWRDAAWHYAVPFARYAQQR
ncbi:DUF6879 family protein [Rhizohabitans arisaemae]|uniref:DUF6879 family protein n=1 Tax=Rhizohabitans arisaemae TaxID=2720610 RepID=UPI0024B24F93|nr:DUF6879 family protein [Rhizohabitans arisaemae]